MEALFGRRTIDPVLASATAAMSPCSVILWLGLLQVPEPPPPGPELQWSAPSGCPDRGALLQGVALRRGRPLTAGEARVDARIRKIGARYVLNLAVSAGPRSERRTLSADTCAPLVDATALLITLTVDSAASRPPTLPPGVEASPGDPSQAPTGTLSPADRDGPFGPDTSSIPGPRDSDPLAPAPGISARPAPTELADDPPPGRSLHEPIVVPPRPARPGALLRLQGGPELGAVPGPSAAVGLAFGLLWPRWRLELQGNFVAPRAVQRPQAELRAWLLSGAVLACVRLGRAGLEFPLCGGFELGGMRGRARGPEVGQAGYGVWFAGVLGGGVAWRVRPRLAVWGALQGLLAVRPSFQLTDPRDPVILFEPSPVSGRLLLGLELRLGDRR